MSGETMARFDGLQAVVVLVVVTVVVEVVVTVVVVLVVVVVVLVVVTFSQADSTILSKFIQWRIFRWKTLNNHTGSDRESYSRK